MKLPPFKEGTHVVLEVAGRVSSWAMEPFIELRGPDTVGIYGLAPGEKGWFRFCLPRMVGERDSTWEIFCRGVGWEEEGSLVWVSQERPQREERILIVAPHPDDAEIAAYGFYSTHAPRAWILTLTGGEWGSCPAVGEGVGERTRRAEVRVAESLELPVRAGILGSRVGNLMLPDGGLGALIEEGVCRVQVDRGLLRRVRERFPEAILPGAWCEGAADAVDQLSRCLEEIRPDIVVCPHWLDSHRDHQATACLLGRAGFRAEWRPRAIYAYSVHPLYSELEPLGREGTTVAPPALLSDAILQDFHVHDLDEATMAAKKKTLQGISDLQDTVPKPSVWLDGLAWVLGSREPGSFVRRAVRRQEWFEVFEPETFFKRAA
ncbi:MAG: PIG-L family deacetylase [Verrucomicrobiia bacterium]